MKQGLPSAVQWDLPTVNDDDDNIKGPRRLVGSPHVEAGSPQWVLPTSNDGVYSQDLPTSNGGDEARRD